MPLVALQTIPLIEEIAWEIIVWEMPSQSEVTGDNKIFIVHLVIAISQFGEEVLLMQFIRNEIVIIAKDMVHIIIIIIQMKYVSDIKSILSLYLELYVM